MPLKWQFNPTMAAIPEIEAQPELFLVINTSSSLS